MVVTITGEVRKSMHSVLNVNKLHIRRVKYTLSKLKYIITGIKGSLYSSKRLKTIER